jgi:hypothetical protein
LRVYLAESDAPPVEVTPIEIGADFSPLVEYWCKGLSPNVRRIEAPQKYLDRDEGLT